LLVRISIHQLQDAVGGEVKLIRVMPNTPCLVGETASAMCLGGSATEDDAEVVRSLFSSVGTIFKVLLLNSIRLASPEPQ